MSGTPNLSIESQTDSDSKTLTLLLTGDIDVTAGEVFDALAEVPADHKVVLDFEAVERVNSMGLAQLLRCLESWKTSSITTEAINLNRMVSMLFKMTGLNRYFGGVDDKAEAPEQPAAVAGEKPSRSRASQFRRVKRNRPDDASESKASEETSQAVAPQPSAAAVVEPVKMAAPDAKMTFSVTLQNNQQLTGWYFLNTLLQRRLDRSISMDIAQLGQEAALHENAVVFAKPFDACSLIANHGYIPIARPLNDSVEVSIVVRSEDSEKSINEFAGASVATSAKESFVFLLGRFFCDEYELDSSALKYQFTGNQLTAMRRLLEKDVDMLFMLKENYNLLSELSREGTEILEETETGMAYHMLLLSPAFANLEAQLTNEFLSLQNDAQGVRALKDLGMESWCKPEPDEIAMLQLLYGRYVN